MELDYSVATIAQPRHCILRMPDAKYVKLSIMSSESSDLRGGQDKKVQEMSVAQQAMRTFAESSRQSGPGDLLQLLRAGNARTKAELASMTRLARSTIAQRVRLLMDLGFVAPVGTAASSGGRPPSTFGFNPGARIVVTIDFGATHGNVALSDLNAQIIGSRRGNRQVPDDPEVALGWALDTAVELLAEIGRGLKDVVGVGIGVPGPVEHSTGRLTKPGWDRFDVPAYIHQTFPAVVLVDNDVNVLAIGEHRTVWPTVGNLLYLKVATGIGAALIMNGELQRGAQGTAGELGHVQVPYNPDSGRNPGDVCNLTALASGSALATMLSAQGFPAETSRDVAALVRAGNATAIQATRQAGRDIGEVLATCVDLLNPEVIVIGGSLGESGEHLIAGVKETVYRRSIPLATQHLMIVPSKSGSNAGAVGAAAMVIEQVLASASIDAMIAAS